MTIDHIFTIISLGIAVLGTASGWVYTSITDRRKERNEKQLEDHRLSVQYITNKRVDWIYEVRNTMSEFIASAERILVGYDNVIGAKLEGEVGQKIWTDYYKLKLLFNYQDEADAKIMEKLDKIMDFIFYETGDIHTEDEARMFMSETVALTQRYLKTEWDRVKREAG